MVVVEPSVTEEKVLLLLGEAAESDLLDFKETVDLSSGRDAVELSKDVGAMGIRGGYIVIGAGDHGRLTDRFTAAAAAAFDEANLRQKLAKYLPDPVSVLVGSHEIDGHRVVVIYVPPQPDGLTIFKADGQYEVPSRDGARTKVVFRAGDVFARHGTSSERWQQTDIDAALSRRDERVREETRADFAKVIAAIESGQRGQQIAAGPPASFTWQLDKETFDATAVEVLRSQDLAALRLFLVTVVGEAERLLVGGDADGLRTLLDRVASLAAIAVTLGLPDALTRTTECMLAIYRLGWDGWGSERQGLALTAPQLWVELIGRVEAVGALAVRLEEWAMVRILAYQPPQLDEDFYFPGWIRHGQVAGSRTGVFRQADGKDPYGLLVAVARSHVHRLSALRPDRPDDSRHGQDPTAEPSATDTLLNSICQFDALAGIVVMALSGKIDDVSFYTSFASYYPARTVPALSRLVSSPAMRAQLLLGVDDDTLSEALAALVKMAHQESLQRMRPWDFDDPAVEKFLAAHRRPRS